MLSGCSLSSISDLDLRECSADDDCAPLNIADGVDADGCVVWQCNSARSCELRERDDDDDGAIALVCGGDDCDDSSAAARPGALEMCDGLDNDCNGQVDDVDTDPAQQTVVADVPDPSWLSVLDSWVAYPSSLGPALDPIRGGRAPRPLTFVSDIAFSSAMLVPGCTTFVDLEPQPPTSEPVGTSEDTCQTHAECDDGVLCNGFETCDPRSPDADALGCRPQGAPACPSEAVCDEDAYLCRERSTELTCSATQLVAAPSTDERWFSAVINDVGCADGELRVGLLDPNGATFAQRGDGRRSAVWPSLGGCRGARDPAIAALSTEVSRRPQAMLAWVTESRVEVVGLWDEEATAGGEPIAWVHGTQSVQLDPIVSGARPSVATHDGGYVVAYPASEGGMWLHRIAALSDPVGVLASEPFRTPIDPAAQLRSAPSLEVSTSRVGSQRIRELVIQVGPFGRLGVAWIDEEGVGFALLEEDVLVRTQRLGEGGVELAVLGAEQGIVSVVAETDPNSHTGGWIVTWVRAGQVWFRRVSAEGQVTGPSRRLGRDARLPQPYVQAGTPYLLFHAGDRGSLVATALCGRRG